MIIKAVEGNTTRGFRSHTDRAALAHFLDGMEPGTSKVITGFVSMRGETVPLPTLQARITLAKAAGTTYRTSAGEAGLTVWRIQ